MTKSMTTPFDDLLPKLPKEVALAAKECWEVCKGSKVGDWMSHIHHTRWLETLTEPVENRIRVILVDKPPAEHTERLRRLRPFDVKKVTLGCKTVETKAYASLDKAQDAYKKNWSLLGKAQTAYDKAWSAFDKSQTAYDKALEAYYEAQVVTDKVSSSLKMLAIHAQVCGCPWGKNKDILGTLKPLCRGS